MVRQAISARFLAAERRLIPGAGHKARVPFVSPRSVPANSRAGHSPASSLDTCPGCDRVVHPVAPGRCAEWHPDGGIRRGCHPSLDQIADLLLKLDAEQQGFYIGGRRGEASLAAYFKAAGIVTDDTERKLRTRVVASLGDEKLLGKSYTGPSPNGPECGACRHGNCTFCHRGKRARRSPHDDYQGGSRLAAGKILRRMRGRHTERFLPDIDFAVERAADSAVASTRLIGDREVAAPARVKYLRVADPEPAENDLRAEQLEMLIRDALPGSLAETVIAKTQRSLSGEPGGLSLRDLARLLGLRSPESARKRLMRGLEAAQEVVQADGRWTARPLSVRGETRRGRIRRRLPSQPLDSVTRGSLPQAPGPRRPSR
ncbi:MAG: hypothetical protein ABSB34_11510 [Candidatus Limnocylindrales bacterium]|jgi:hypothetical protein